MSPKCSCLAVVTAAALALAVPLAAQTALPIGKQAQGRVSSGGSTDYTIVAKTAGVLVAAVRGDGDMVVQVTDSDGQTLPDGRSDRDLNGSTGNELLSVIIPEAGSYRVRVSVNGSGAARFDKARLHQAEFGSGMLPVKLDRLMPLVAVQLMAAIQIRAAKPMRAILARRRGQAYALGVREPFAAVLALIAGPTSARPAKGLFEALLEAPMSKGRIAVAGR